MKVKIKKPVYWVGPYQIAEKLCFWARPVEDEFGILDKPDWVHNFGGMLSKTPLLALCRKIHDIREKLNKPKIKIHNYDTWCMDRTLSPIILPMLKQLKAEKHGSPYTDDEDVPEELRMSPPPEDEPWKDDTVHERWAYVLDAMIWSFEQLTTDWEDQFHSGECDHVFTPVDKEGNEVPREEAKLFRMDHGPNHTHVFDIKAYEAHQERISFGLRMFGKYYQGLWD